MRLSRRQFSALRMSPRRRASQRTREFQATYVRPGDDAALLKCTGASPSGGARRSRLSTAHPDREREMKVQSASSQANEVSQASAAPSGGPGAGQVAAPTVFDTSGHSPSDAGIRAGHPVRGEQGSPGDGGQAPLRLRGGGKGIPWGESSTSSGASGQTTARVRLCRRGGRSWTINGNNWSRRCITRAVRCLSCNGRADFILRHAEHRNRRRARADGRPSAAGRSRRPHVCIDTSDQRRKKANSRRGPRVGLGAARRPGAQPPLRASSAQKNPS